ncbi:hypothetical protein DFH06DRAFT_1397229 [Mycena polygramma]|nr:hypothetical protein DFH06DRAFT_1397229 [Mycena polygramma]
MRLLKRDKYQKSKREKMSGVPPHLRPAPGTRHHGLLTSNQPPLDSDFLTVQSVLFETDARLVSVDDEIACVSQQLEKLKQKRSSLSSYRAQNGSILSLLRRMPPEILGEIFMRTLPSPRRRKRIQIADSPWVLTHVCQDWKKIALSIHSLWSSVIVSYLPETGAGTYSLAMVETQIARAQNAKLKIHFYGNGHVSGNSQEQIEMFKTLARHATRWAELNAQLTLALFPLVANLRGNLPSLRKLWIRWSGHTLHMLPQDLETFKQMPCLRDIGVLDYSRAFPFHFPAQHLTRYELEAPWDTHRRILLIAKNLVEACIINSDQPLILESGETIDLAHLRRLYVDDVGQFSILRFLRVPVLEELATGTEIAIGNEDEATHILPHLDAFLTRSSSIRSLRLDPSADNNAIIDILHRFPSIVELAISLEDRRRGISITAAPQLRSLSLGWEAGANIDYHALLEMVKSRMRADHCALKQIVLLLTEGTFGPDSTFTELKMLREEGLDVVVLDGEDASEVMDDWVFHRRY